VVKKTVPEPPVPESGGSSPWWGKMLDTTSPPRPAEAALAVKAVHAAAPRAERAVCGDPVHFVDAAVQSAPERNV